MQRSELASKRPLVPTDINLPDQQKEVLDTFMVAAQLGRAALGAYVISMATSVSDILAVVLLQKEARLRHTTADRYALPLLDRCIVLPQAHGVVHGDRKFAGGCAVVDCKAHCSAGTVHRHVAAVRTLAPT